MEYCLIDIVFPSDFVMNLLYRPPNDSLNDFGDKLVILVNRMRTGDISFICGDLNF